MFTINGTIHANPKFLTVRATKQKNKGSSSTNHPGDGKHMNRMIKLELVDHSTEHGIPYKKQIQGEQEEEDGD